MDMFTASSDLDLSLNVGNVPVERSRSDKISFLRKLTRSLYGLQNGSLFSTPWSIAKVFRHLLEIGLLHLHGTLHSLIFAQKFQFH
jgi:hypothetical protein